MKPFFKCNVQVIIGLIAVSLFTSCLKDTGKQTVKVYTPVLESYASLKAKIKSENPRAIRNAGKLFVLGNYVYVNEMGKGIHVIDNSNPNNPIAKNFIVIPGNLDVAVKNNILYADSYSYLFAIDISNPSNVRVVKEIDNIFNDRNFIRGFSVPQGFAVVDWVVKDSTIAIALRNGMGYWNNNNYFSSQPVFWGPQFGGTPTLTANGGSNNGIAGSMSRFAFQNNYLYSVSNSTLSVLSVSNASNPTVVNNVSLGWNIETIYPFKDKLFIGSQTGMFIYDVSNATQPTYISSFAHARLCDPVIADDTHAYVTLHSSEDICVGTQNELNVLDISHLSSPTLLKRINLTKPHGLGKQNNVLLVCDDNSGLRVFNAANKDNPILVNTINLPGAYDVICLNGIALVTAKDGLYQFDYTNINNIRQLSKVAFAF